MSKTYRIAVIAVDGIGREVVPEGMRVLEAAARRHKVVREKNEGEYSNMPIRWLRSPRPLA